MKFAIRAGLLLILVAALSSRAAAESKEDYEERLKMEVTTVLDKFLGVGMSQVVVLVDADPQLMVPPIREVGKEPKVFKKPKAPQGPQIARGQLPGALGGLRQPDEEVYHAGVRCPPALGGPRGLQTARQA